MPDLTARLTAAATELRPSGTPGFEVVQRRVTRRRRRRTAVVSAAAVVALTATAVGAAVGLQPRDSLQAPLAGPGPTGLPGPAVPPSLAGAVPEPTPFTVPTSPATDALPVVGPSRVTPLEDGERSIPWQLIRAWDGGRGLAIQYDPGCNSEPPEVRVEETPEHVLVQVVDRDGMQVRACLQRFRSILELSAPLAGRPLLHAATTSRSEPDSGTRSLAERFEDAPEWPGEPWFRDGREVTSSEPALAAGPEHCEWQEAVYLSGSGLRAPRDRDGALWSRDPKGVQGYPRLQSEFRARATLPADAAFTGYAQGPVEVWVAPSDDFAYVYLVNGEDRGDVERWVRGGGGCA